MAWNKKRRLFGKNAYYSISKKLRKESKSSEEFELMLNGLSLEDVIALKLELAMKAAGAPIYGVPLWRSVRDICKDSMLKLSLSATRTKKEAANFLGIAFEEFRTELKRRNIEGFFEEN